MRLLLTLILSLWAATASAQTIPYTDSRLAWLGRWYTSGGKISTWEGAQLRFRVSGTNTVTVNAYCVSLAGGFCTIAASVDQGATQLIHFVDGAASGNYTATITLPDTGVHDIIVKTESYPHQWDGSMYTSITGVQIDDGGTLTAYPDTGTVHVLCIGDSWMAAENDWPRFLAAKYGIWPAGIGGYTAASMDAIVNYQRPSIAAADPSLDAAVISFGVNDYNAGISTASYQTSLLSIVDKVRAQQPSAKIFLLQTPRNVGAGRNYDQYGTAMQTIAGLRSNVYYISTSSVWGGYTWADPNHLSLASRQSLAAFVSVSLDGYFPALTTAASTATMRASFR